MKITLLVGRLFVFICLSSLAHGQLVVMGEIKSATGSFDGQFKAGDPVAIDIAFVARDTSLDGLFPNEAEYYTTTHLSIAGKALFVFAPTIVELIDLPGMRGLRIRNSWSGGLGNAAWNLSLYSSQSIPSTLDLFPAAIPFEEFDNASGWYTDLDRGNEGRLDWLVTSYQGYFGSPVPESNALGFAGSATLFCLAVYRRAKQKPKLS